MDTTGKNEQIEKETLRLMLEEFTQEQKNTNQTINNLVAAVNSIGSKVDNFKQELDNPKSIW
jgi:flagellar basal body P-ring protein FlgI